MSKTTIIVDDGGVAVAGSETGKSGKKNSSHGFLKFLSVLLLALFVAALFVPKYFQLGANMGLVTGSVAAKDQTVFTVILENLKTIFKDRPGFSQSCTLLAKHKMAWLLGACAVALLISTIITLCCKKSAAGWFGIDCAILVVVGLPYGYKCLNGTKYIDLFLIACVLALIFLIIVSFARGGKKNFLPFLCFVALTALMTLTLMYNFFPRTEASIYKNSSSLFIESGRVYLRVFKNLVLHKSAQILLYENMAYIMFGVLLACWILTTLQLATVKKTTWFSVIRYIALLGVAVASMIIVMTTDALKVKDDIAGYIKEYPYYIITIAVALILFLLSLIVKLPRKQKAAKVVKEEKTEEPATAEPVAAPLGVVASEPATAAVSAQTEPAATATQYQPAPVAYPYYRAYDPNARTAPSVQNHAYPATTNNYYTASAPAKPEAPAYPMPNIYINITNGTNGAPAEVKVNTEEAKPAAQTAIVTTASSTKEEKPVDTVMQDADRIAQDIQVEEAKETNGFVSVAPVVTETKETKTVVKKAKRRSFWLFLGFLCTIAALVLYTIWNKDAVVDLFKNFVFNPETILPVAFLAGGVLAVIFGFIALCAASKGCGVVSFLFTVVFAAAYLIDIQLYGTNNIVKSITSVDVQFIVIAALAILAVICSFIGFIRTGKRKVNETVTEKVAVATPAKAPAKIEKADKKAVAPVAAPVISEEPEAEEASAEAEPEDSMNDPFIDSLSVLNKREFKKVFLEGNAPSYLPEYTIGGDNTDFFDAIFVYLGKIRSVISPSLLAAIYDHINK